MKILHTSDLHIGKTLHERDLLPDQDHMLGRLEAAVREHNPAALVIAGDVYDRAIPPPEAVSLFSGFLGRIKADRPDLTVLVISGNHDSPARLGFGDSIFRLAGVHLRTRAEDAATPIPVERGGERLRLWALPFLGPASFPEAPASQSGQFAEAMRRITPLLAGGGANVLVCHAFAAGGQSSDSERTFLGAAEMVDAEAFSAFDYAALGHLHRPQKAGSKGRYPGSPLAYSFSEAGQAKGFLLVDVRKGSFEETFLPMEPIRPLSRLEGKYADFLSRGAEAPQRDHYLEVFLADPEPVLSPAEALRRVFPNLLSIRQKAFEDLARGVEESAAAELLPDGPPRDSARAALEDFAAFHRAVKGREPDEAVSSLFKELLKEAVDAAPQA